MGAAHFLRHPGGHDGGGGHPYEVFSYSSVWGEEIVRYSFIYLAWIAAAAAVRERGHIRIDVLFHYVPNA